MSKPVSFTVSHELGREAAIGRLRTGLDRVRAHLARFRLQLVEERWEENRLHFAVAALGTTVRGTLTVEDSLVRVEMMLPWMLAMFAEKLQRRVETEGRTLLLDKPRA